MDGMQQPARQATDGIGRLVPRQPVPGLTVQTLSGAEWTLSGTFGADTRAR